MNTDVLIEDILRFIGYPAWPLAAHVKGMSFLVGWVSYLPVSQGCLRYSVTPIFGFKQVSPLLPASVCVSVFRLWTFVLVYLMFYTYLIWNKRNIPLLFWSSYRTKIFEECFNPLCLPRLRKWKDVKIPNSYSRP